jgi:hypothetical protein
VLRNGPGVDALDEAVDDPQLGARLAFDLLRQDHHPHVLLGIGGSFNLTGSNSNAVGTLAASTGSVDFNDNSSLTVGAADGTSGVTGSGPVTLTTSGSLTIASVAQVSTSGTGNNVVLSAAANFINNAGSNAVSASGNWLIYSNAPGGDTFGNLNSNHTAIWDATNRDGAPGECSGRRQLLPLRDAAYADLHVDQSGPARMPGRPTAMPSRSWPA